MTINFTALLGILGFLIVAPILGCLLAGLDRKITAGMQGRVGPKLLQPYYDVRKLMEKEAATVNGAQDLYVSLYFVFMLLAGCAFFSGGNFLLCVFVLTLGTLFLILAAYVSRSPYAEIGAQREMIQVMAYEPMVLLVAIAVYMAVGSFEVSEVVTATYPLLYKAPLIFIGFLYVLTIKLRKSPFDISMSHHAHQEIVRGLTTEFSGRTLALVEASHWYESILFLGWVGMFLLNAGGIHVPILTVVICLAVYFLEIWIDNNFARVKWQAMLKTSWLLALILGGINIVYLLVA